MAIYLPSPAASMCSEDLEAILTAAGPMSQLPTPPLSHKGDALPEIFESLPDEVDPIDYDTIGEILAREASQEDSPSNSDLYTVKAILHRALLPPELIAFAYNILQALNNVPSISHGSLASTPCGLLATAALTLAVSYSCDYPFSYQYWSLEICSARWTAQRIDKAAFVILRTIDFRLRECCVPDAIERMTEEFRAQSIGHEHESGDSISGSRFAIEKAKIDDEARDKTAGSTARWLHGQLTPEASPPLSLVNALGAEFLSYL